LTRTKLIAGNWKMHGSMVENAALLSALKAVKTATPCAVCAPFPYLAQLQNELRASAIAWGAQNLSEFHKGAYTGEVSGSMLREFGCTYAIVGHSERRTLYEEHDAVVARKFVAAQHAGLIPILCVGETLEQREAGTTEQVIERQLDAVLIAVGADAFERAVIAYEPVWAIGTGKTASPEDANAVHAFIRRRLASDNAAIAQALRILYGGSVKASNAVQLFAMPDIDGGLVGGASLDAREFSQILQATGRASAAD
jgi:triosephosphate isomerase (TIM)